MDIASHAQLIAQLCSTSFAQLVLEVPTCYKRDHELARQLISSISHADKMAAIGEPPAPGMIFELAQKLLHTACRDSIVVQSTAAHQLIRLVSHANGMARIVPQVADDIFALVRPLVDDPLPTEQAQLDRLSHQERDVCTEIQRICHEAQMRQIAAGM